MHLCVPLADGWFLFIVSLAGDLCMAPERALREVPASLSETLERRESESESGSDSESESGLDGR